MSKTFRVLATGTLILFPSLTLLAADPHAAFGQLLQDGHHAEVWDRHDHPSIRWFDESNSAIRQRSITTERSKEGKTVTGMTQKFGSGTITRWSDGTTTDTRPLAVASSRRNELEMRSRSPAQRTDSDLAPSRIGRTDQSVRLGPSVTEPSPTNGQGDRRAKVVGDLMPNGLPASLLKTAD